MLTAPATRPAVARFSCAGPASASRRKAPAPTRSFPTLAKHAFRRPATPADLKVLMEFYLAGRNEGGTLRRRHRSGAAAHPGGSGIRVPRRDGSLPAWPPARAIASAIWRWPRGLSFFLWSSIPDDELIDLAAQGKLKDPAVLEQQVRRHARRIRASAALIDNFTGQWLSVRSLKTSEPVVNLFPDFDDNLRTAFQREIELFFGSIVREDRSVLDLLDADYTFVNERLAKHYGIPNVYGPQFRRVTLPAELDMRRGLLGKGALLTVTSQAARTSPVIRGKWFLQTFLGVSPPDPPPDVDTVSKRKPSDTTGNLKVADDAADSRIASRESGLRDVPQDLRADGPGAREL